MMKKFQEEAIPKFAEYFVNRKKEYGQNGYIIGPKVCYFWSIIFVCDWNNDFFRLTRVEFLSFSFTRKLFVNY